MNNVCQMESKHCSGCGLCEGICPTEAIKIREQVGFLRPHINDSKCISCGKCIKYCPGIHRNSAYISWGHFEYVVYGHSASPDLRKEAASGGVTTELLQYLLQKKRVDYVITASSYLYDRNLSYNIIESEQAKKLYSLAGSNYCPVNVGRAIAEIKKREGTCAIVCLPCLARGIRLLQEKDKEIRKKIKYVICLLCNHVPSYEATDYLVKKYRMKKPAMIKYRGNGWFGEFRAYSNIENGTEYCSVPFSEYFGSKFSEYFWQEACINCRDHFGENADICVGDADFIKYREKESLNNGETICFSNNKEIIDILYDMQKEKRIILKEDICENELESIYGVLSKERADKRNLASGYRKILNKEKRVRLKSIIYEKIVLKILAFARGEK